MSAEPYLSVRRSAAVVSLHMQGLLALVTCFALGFVYSVPAWALNPDLQLSQYSHSAWSARDGAFRGTILSMTQTRDGYLWFGTGFGLLRFDGVRFVEWRAPADNPLPKPPFFKVFGSRDGSLWIGANHGLARIKDGKVTNFPQMNVDGAGAIVEDHDGTIWTGDAAQGGRRARLCAIRGDQVTCVGEDNAFGTWVRSLYVDSKGTLWVAAMPGVWRWKPGAPKLYPGDGAAVDLASDERDTLLIANYHELRAVIDGKDQAYPIEIPGGPVSTTALMRDKDGGVWIGTEGQGIAHLHQGQVDLFRREDGLSNNSVNSFFEDREGNVWVSTFNGLDRFRELAIPSLSAKEKSVADGVGSVLAGRDGSLWTTSANGIWYSSGKKVERYSKSTGLPDDYVSSIFEGNDGHLLLSTAGGFGWLQNGKYVASEIPGDEVFAIAQDPAGHYWICDHQKGLIQAGPDGKVIDMTSWKRFQGRFARSVAWDRRRGGLWLGFYGFSEMGLAFFKEGQIVEQYGPSQGFVEQVTDIQIDNDGAVWASTTGGLSRLKDGQVKFLNSKSGLPCDNVFWKREDEAGSTWLLTECGLVRLSTTELDRWSRDPLQPIKILSIFGPSDGVEERFQPGYYTPQVTKTADGRLLFVQEGLGVIDPRKLPVNSYKPPTAIEQVTADGKDYRVSFSPMMISPRVHELRIDYTALSFVDSQKVRFRYQLEGHDEVWQEPGTRRQAFYSDLRPGRYRFHVIACNNDGLWNEEGASLELRVAPAWYQTKTTVIVGVGTFALLLWSAYRLRVHQVERQLSIRLEERVAERTRIARELHDTLLQSTQGLILLFQGIANRLLRNDPTRDEMERGLEYADRVLVEARDRVRALRHHDPEDDVASHIASIGREVTAASTAEFIQRVAGTPRRLQPGIREDVDRIVREALLNAVRHANASRVEAQLCYDDGRFLVRIVDDGIGVDPEVLRMGALPGHYGIVGMRERAKSIGATLLLIRGDSGGTEVHLAIPADRAYAPSR